MGKDRRGKDRSDYADHPDRTPTKDTPFGPSGATPRPGQEKGRLDKPAKPEDDFATDERRSRAIQGQEDIEDQRD